MADSLWYINERLNITIKGILVDFGYDCNVLVILVLIEKIGQEGYWYSEI
jgi:hypothetical protein